LIEQRLKKMKVAPVDERDVYRRAAKRTGRVETAESAAENEDAMPDASRIAKPRRPAALAISRENGRVWAD